MSGTNGKSNGANGSNGHGPHTKLVHAAMGGLSEEQLAYAIAAHEAEQAGLEVPPAPPGLTTPRRVPLLSEDLIEDLRKATLTGAPPEIVAASRGIPPKVWRAWLKLGSPPRGFGLYVKLLATIEQAEAQWEVDSCGKIALGQGKWQGRAWLLERRRSDQYALKTRQELSGPAGSPILIAAGRAQLPPEEPEDAE